MNVRNNTINDQVLDNLDGYLFQKLLDNFPDSIYFKDLQSRFIRVNKAKLDRFHVKDESEMLGKTDFDFFIRDRAQDAYNDEQEIIRTGKPLLGKIEKNIFPGSNKPKWVLSNKVAFEDKQGKIIGTMGVSQDITDRVEKEQALAEYKNIIETMTESVWVGDKTGITTYVNPNFCELLGYTFDEVIGEKSEKFWSLQSSGKSTKNPCGRMRGKHETVMQAKDGTTIPVLVSCTPLADGNSARIIMDLREVKQIQEHADHLQELNALKDEFISIVSHELRTPMTVIKGYASLMLEGDLGKVNDNLKEPIGKIMKETNRLIEMINDILDVAKLEAGKMIFSDQVFPISEFLYEIHENLSYTAKEKGLHLELNIAEDCINTNIHFDQNKLKQIFMNLVGNALKFTPEWGSVTIRISSEAAGILVEIIDTGVGIPKDKQSQLFEKFKQVDNYLQKSSKGSGLGLYICKKILANYHTDLQCASEENKGSNFFFVIPN